MDPSVVHFALLEKARVSLVDGGLATQEQTLPVSGRQATWSLSMASMIVCR